MLLKLLDALEKNVIRHECAIYDILCDYNNEEIGKKCESDCVECGENLIEQIIKLKQTLKTSDVSSETRKELDNVNHPSHYNAPKHECIDEMITVFGVEAVKHFCMCNAWKYRYRAGAKDGEEKEKDLAKADWYIEILMELGQKGETK